MALSFLQLLTIKNHVMNLFFMDLCFDFIAENTILTKNVLESLPQGIMLSVSFTATLLTSMFHALLAEALYVGNARAYIIGALFHSCSAVSSFTLWVLGINTLKLIGLLFFSLNLAKAAYLYTKSVKSRIKEINIQV